MNNIYVKGSENGENSHRITDSDSEVNKENDPNLGHTTHNSTDGEEVTQKFGAEGLTLEEIAEGNDPINTEKVDLIKPTSTKRKRITKKK